MGEFRIPPIGLPPRWIVFEEGVKYSTHKHIERFDEIKKAIKRYLDSSHTIPNEWVQEYNNYVKVFEIEGVIK